MLVYFPTVAGYSSRIPTKVRLSWVDLWVPGSAPRWFTRPETITHPGTSRARRGVTTLIETNALPLSQTDTDISTQISKRERQFYWFLVNRNHVNWFRAFKDASSQKVIRFWGIFCIVQFSKALPPCVQCVLYIAVYKQPTYCLHVLSHCTRMSVNSISVNDVFHMWRLTSESLHYITFHSERSNSIFFMLVSWNDVYLYFRLGTQHSNRSSKCDHWKPCLQRARRGDYFRPRSASTRIYEKRVDVSLYMPDCACVARRLETFPSKSSRVESSI